MPLSFPELAVLVELPRLYELLKPASSGSAEPAQLGGRYEVVHHTQLLNRLVREGRLTPVAPVAPVAAASTTPATYHDPCYIGRHNGVYDPPRELIGALPGVALTEMPRHGNRSFC